MSDCHEIDNREGLCREKFEEWYKRNGGQRGWDVFQWDAWQAAWNHRVSILQSMSDAKLVDAVIEFLIENYSIEIGSDYAAKLITTIQAPLLARMKQLENALNAATQSAPEPKSVDFQAAAALIKKTAYILSDNDGGRGSHPYLRNPEEIAKAVSKLWGLSGETSTSQQRHPARDAV